MKRLYELVMWYDGFWTNDGYGDAEISDDRDAIVAAAESLWALGGEYTNARFAISTIGDTGESMRIDEIEREDNREETEMNFYRLHSTGELVIDTDPQASELWAIVVNHENEQFVLDHLETESITNLVAEGFAEWISDEEWRDWQSDLGIIRKAVAL